MRYIFSQLGWVIICLAALRAETVHSLLLQDNKLWVTTDKGVVRWNINNLGYKIYTKATSGLSKNDVTCLVIDTKGGRWFGTKGGGVCHGAEWSDWQCFMEIDGVASNHISCGTRDPQGDLWFGTKDNGVSQYQVADRKWKNFSEAEGLTSNVVRDILARKNGEIWVATDKGIGVYRDGLWSAITAADGAPSDDVRDLTETGQGVIWAACGEGMGQGGGIGKRSSGGDWTVYRKSDGLGDNDAYCVEIDKRGNVWCGTYSGASMYNGSTWKDHNLTDNPLAEEWVYAIAIDKANRVWLGTSKGLYQFDGDRNWALFKAE